MNAIQEAAAAVEADGRGDRVTHDGASESAGSQEIGANDAMQPGEGQSSAVEPEGEGILSRLQQPLSGSIREDRVGELWNPEQGGLNRAVLVAEETFGLGDGLPRIAHVAIALAEMAEQPPRFLDSSSTSDAADVEADPDARRDDPPSKGDTAEVVNYDGS